MFQMVAGLIAVVQHLVISIFTSSADIVRDMQPDPAKETLAKTVCGVQLGVFSLATRTFEGEKTTLANGFMSLSERMKPSDTSGGLVLGLIGNASRGTNYVLKVGTFVNYDDILEKYDEQASGVDEKDRIIIPERRKYHYEGAIVGRECGLILTAGVNYMPHSQVDGFQIAGIANEAKILHGVQIAAWSNSAEDGAGLQIGLLNNGGNMSGLQIGLLNCINHTRDNPSYLPIINAAW